MSPLGITCVAPNCANRRAKGRNLCHSCRHKREQQKDPVRYAFWQLKRNASKRGIPFSLTLEHFAAFCQSTEYIAWKGRTLTALSVDRIDRSKGYEPGNLQVLTNSENIRKFWHYEYGPEERRMRFHQTRPLQAAPDPSIPF